MYFFRKKDPNQPNNINIKIMHIINATAIIACCRYFMEIN
ncbi:DUF6728 family protein [Pedobacter frigoris]|nr:DUF6728 family protein [Pedobacter frigoris]